MNGVLADTDEVDEWDERQRRGGAGKGAVCGNTSAPRRVSSKARLYIASLDGWDRSATNNTSDCGAVVSSADTDKSGRIGVTMDRWLGGTQVGGTRYEV